jgi:hypothetical protein
MDCASPISSAAIERHVAKSVRLALEADLQGADYFNISAADTAMERSTRGHQGWQLAQREASSVRDILAVAWSLRSQKTPWAKYAEHAF